MAEGTIQQQLIAVVRQTRQAEHDLVASLSEASRDAYGKIDAWVAKDVVMHVNSWKEVLTGNFVDGREGRETDLLPDFLAYNDVMFNRFQNASWNEVNAYADGVIEALIAEIQQYNDTQLQQPKIHAWMRDTDTIASQVLGTVLMHSYQHLSEVYVKEGNADAAVALQQTIIPAYEQLSNTPRALGTAHYNLACIYILMGRNDLALPLIRTAFDMRPDLMELAKTDSDMNGIRDDADFQALYADTAQEA